MVAAVTGGYESLDADTKARVAFMRFGFGPKPQGRASLGSDENAAYNACLAELNNPDAAIISDDRVRVVYGDWPDFDGTIVGCYKVAPSPGERPRTAWRREAAERYVQFMAPQVGFVERLVQFWQNHFSVWSSKASCFCGHLDRYAIRRNVLGNFSDMLLAVERHPAMIRYLDNHLSVGPNSPYTVKWMQSAWVKRQGPTYAVNNRPTYNENLAREILELHTLGVDGGYTQADVTAFAKMLTGWTSVRPNVFYNADVHEPGAQTVMGRTYGQADGARQVSALLRDLALHPSTATHIATKLIRHFITDDPSEADIATLAGVFTASKGNLYEVSKTLLELPSAWTTPFERIKQPLPWAVSVMRGLGTSADEAFRNAWKYDLYIGLLDWAFWGRVTPDGYPDDNSFWLTGDAIRVRRDVAAKIVETRMQSSPTMAGFPGNPPTRPTYATADDLAVDLLGRYRTPALKDLLKGDVRTSLPLIFLSPEYIRS